MSAGRAALADALRSATLMVSVQGRTGTGFFVAPGHVLTCAHVIVEPGREPPISVAAQWGDIDLELKVTRTGFLEKHDLALLEVVAKLDHPVACLATQIEPGDELWAYGHPSGAYRSGDVIRMVYDGPSIDRDGAELLRVTEGRAVEGFSGGPVLSWRTGGVCGILRRADAPPGGPPGARLVGARQVFDAFPRLRPPSVLTQDRLPWFQLLSDAQLASGHWCYPGPRLRHYLEAAQQTARKHPYQFALPNAPELSTVYLRQQATRIVGGKQATGDDDDLAEMARPVPADLVLEGDRRCVFVVGDPGTGKSSLLRHLAETTAGRWLNDAGAPGVPILITAEALAADRPLPDALAEGVTAALGARLADRQLAGLFESEPLPRIPWLILVDGVDEILDPERRSRVLETVVFWQSQRSPYRFLVTSRPLAQGLLDALRKAELPVYDIEPFSPDQLPEFAERWFSALGMPDPGAMAEAFLDRLAGSQLSRLAEIPLIATMLCVVFASQADQRLPLSRVGLYENFVSVLMAKRHTQTNALERLQRWIRPYGAAAEQAVDQLLAKLRLMLEHVADQRRRAAGPRSLVELAVLYVRDLCPAQLPTELWRDLVEEALRLSGLVVERSGHLTFFHYTVEEYLAVCAREVPAIVISEVLKEQRHGRDSFSLLRCGVLVSRVPAQAREVAVALSREGLNGLRFLAELIYDGVPFPDDVVVGARATLEAFAAAPDYELSGRPYDATEALTLIDPDLGFRYWGQFVNDNNLADVSRVEAIRGLVRSSPRRAGEVLESVALKWESPLGIRQTIVYKLTVLNQARSHELLIKMAMARHIDGQARRWAVTTLCSRIDKPMQLDLLATIANECDMPGSYRRWAATRLFGQDPERGAETLSTVAEDRTVDGADRLWAAEIMINVGWDTRRWRPRAAGLLAMIALDPAADGPSRIRAAQGLKNENPQRAQALRLIAVDPYVDAVDRVHAAVILADLDPPRAVAALATVAADPEQEGDGRIKAALALAWISRTRAATALLEITADTRVDGECRSEAAHQLDWIDRRALPSALRIIAFDTQVGGAHRIRAALRLSYLSPEPGRAALEVLVTDLSVNGPDRLQAACRLAAMKSDKAPAALASLSAERDLSDARRLHAALEFGGSDPLAELAADGRVSGMHRVRAAFELTAVDRDRGISALAALSEDPTADDVRDELARTETLRIRRERTRYFQNHPSGRDTENAPAADLDRIRSYRVQAALLLGHYDRATAVERLTALAEGTDQGVASQAAAALMDDSQSQP